MRAVSREIAIEYLIRTLRKMERDKPHSLRTWVLILALPLAYLSNSCDMSEPPLPYLESEKHYTYFLIGGEGGQISPCL